MQIGNPFTCIFVKLVIYMSLKNRRFILFVLFGLGFTLAYTQTLYWVGGSGSFNDSNHWSTSSGGNPSGISPGPNSNLIFDNGDDFSQAEISLSGTLTVNSINISTYRKINVVGALPSSKLIVKKGFNNLIDNKNFKLTLLLEFNNVSTQTQGNINLGDFQHNSDVFITAGNWKINGLYLLPTKKIEISNSKINFDGSFIECGFLEFKNCTYLNFNQAVIKARNEIKVENCLNYSIKKSFIGKNFYDGNLNDSRGLNGLAGKFSNNNQISAVCWTASLITVPSCFPGCDGVVQITLPPLACWNTTAVGAYDIGITNSSCSFPGGLSNLAPGTYTIGGFCGCVSQYNIVVTDANSNLLFDNNGVSIKPISVAAPAISLIASSSQSVNCFGSCTGSVSASFFGGTAP